MHFSIASRKFLGFIVTQKRIKMNPEKIEAISNMPSLTTPKEVQVLTRRIVEVGHFVLKLGSKCISFSKIVQKVSLQNFSGQVSVNKLFKI